MINLKYYGLSCFELEASECTIITDPFDTGKVAINRGNLSGDVVVQSKNHSDLLVGPEGVALSANRKEKNLPLITIAESGEYEVGGVFVRTYDNPFLHIITLDDLNICYLGMLGSYSEEDDLESMGEIDYLILPVGDEGSFLSWKIMEKLIKKIDPAYVIPCCYKQKGLSEALGNLKSLEEFLAEFAGSNYEEKTTLKMTSVSRAEEDEQYKVIVMKKLI